MLKVGRFTRNGLALAATVAIAVSGPIAILGVPSGADVWMIALGALVAALFSLRLWSLPLFLSRPASWWLWVSTVVATIGAFLWAIDIRLGYFVPNPSAPEFLGSVANPMAVLVSAAFLPLGVAIGLGSAVRASLLGDDTAIDEG